MSERNPTIHDVAAAAGVGVGTVSRVLNDHPNVSERTRQHVLDVIERTSYRPRHAAREIRTKRSRLIGLLADSVTTTPFAYELIRGAQDRARQAGLMLLVIDPAGDRDECEQAVLSFRERGVDGILYGAMFHHRVRLPENLQDVPAILVNCYADGGDFAAVVPDEVQGGYDATRHLLERGHRRIGIITSDLLRTGYPAVTGRLEGYQRALADHGVPFDPELLREGEGLAASGYRLTGELLQRSRPPTALFCGTDRTAMGAYEAIKQRGLRIPDDISLVGFDNQVYVADSLNPPLTTMELPHFSMGRWAVDRLLRQRSGSEPEPVRHKLPCPLIERSSVRAIG